MPGSKRHNPKGSQLDISPWPHNSLASLKWRPMSACILVHLRGAPSHPPLSGSRDLRWPEGWRQSWASRPRGVCLSGARGTVTPTASWVEEATLCRKLPTGAGVEGPPPHSPGDSAVSAPSRSATDTVPKDPAGSCNGHLSSQDLIKCTEVMKLGACRQGAQGWRSFLFFTVRPLRGRGGHRRGFYVFV